MAYENISAIRDGAVLTVTLNRPEQLNPLDHATLSELAHCLESAAEDEHVEIIVLRGAGRAFSAGGDVKAYLSFRQDAERMGKQSALGNGVMRRIETIPQIVIAVVEGLCVAGGIETILCCDYVIATEDARFSDGHLNLALLPGAGGTQRMPRLVGALKAKDIMLTARMFDGREAAELGLVTTCVPTDALEATLADLIASLGSKSFAARAAIKYLVNEGLRGSLESGLRFEQAYTLHFETTHPDALEGLTAFSEKRKPDFRRKTGQP